MKRQILLLSGLFFVFCSTCYSQGQLTVPHEGGSKKASVSELIGITKITVNYGRPAVKGREGKIWGTSVAHYGYKDLGFGSSKASPWRAGANDNTTITFSSDVKVEGKTIAAGTYGLFMELGESETIVIFSNNSTSFGSFFYNPAEDALRVTVKNQPYDKTVEWLKYEFINETDSSATLALIWEKRLIPFKIDVDINKVQLESFRRELRTTPGFIWQSYDQAAEYCLLNNVELEQGLIWADQAISGNFVGQKNFQTLSTKADILVKLNREAEAQTIMNEALPMGDMLQLHQYGKTLLLRKKAKDAFNIFKLNYDKHPNLLTTNVGMARGYSALGDYKKALEYVNAALAEAPNPSGKVLLEDLIKKLEKGEDIN